MAEPKPGFSISGNTVSGMNITQGDNNQVVQGDGNQAVVGNNNQVNQAAGAESITQTDVVDLLARIETLIAQAELPNETVRQFTPLVEHRI